MKFGAKRLFRRRPRRAARKAPPRLGIWRQRRFAYNPTPTFTETLDFGTFSLNGTSPFLGQLYVTPSSIPQLANYQALYNQICIRKVKYYLMPAFTSYQPLADTTSANQSVSAPRLTYAIQDTAMVPSPISELDVLTDNGAKIKMFDKPIKITHTPTAWLGEVLSTPSANLFTPVSQKNVWITMGAGAVGTSVKHGAINYCVVQDNPALHNTQTQWAIYAKITFSLRDPK